MGRGWKRTEPQLRCRASPLPDNCFFGACSAFTHVTACTLAESPSDPLHRELRQLCCIRCRLDCYRVERTSSRGRDRAEARALSHEKTQSRFLGPPCNPGRSDFPIPVLALAIPERSFQDRGSSSARSHTPHPFRFTSRLVLLIMAPPTYAVGHTGTAKCPELLCLSPV